MSGGVSPFFCALHSVRGVFELFRVSVARGNDNDERQGKVISKMIAIAADYHATSPGVVSKMSLSASVYLI